MIVEFKYVQPGHVQSVLGRIVSIRDTHTNPLSLATLLNDSYKIENRSRYLVTVALSDGRVKNYYHGSMRNFRQVSELRQFRLWQAGINFGS